MQSPSSAGQNPAQSSNQQHSSLQQPGYPHFNPHNMGIAADRPVPDHSRNVPPASILAGAPPDWTKFDANWQNPQPNHHHHQQQQQQQNQHQQQQQQHQHQQQQQHQQRQSLETVRNNNISPNQTKPQTQQQQQQQISNAQNYKFPQFNNDYESVLQKLRDYG